MMNNTSSECIFKVSKVNYVLSIILKLKRLLPLHIATKIMLEGMLISFILLIL